MCMQKRMIVFLLSFTFFTATYAGKKRWNDIWTKQDLNPARIRGLLKDYSVDAQDNDRCTLLHRAAIYLDAKAATLLITQHKADVNVADKAQDTPLHSLVSASKYLPGYKSGKAIAVIEALIDGGADVKKTNKAGLTPVTLAEELQKTPDKLKADIQPIIDHLRNYKKREKQRKRDGDQMSKIHYWRIPVIVMLALVLAYILKKPNKQEV